MASRTLTFVTGNVKKLEEVRAILSAGGGNSTWELVAKDIDLPELQGEPKDIAEEKCRMAARKVQGPVITEDTCLCFNALNGLPGPYIKWFLKKLGHEGLNNLLAAYEDKTGFAQCTFVYSPGGDSPVEVFVGKTKGAIVPARGPHNFGWDPIFQPDGFKETYAEMETQVKNTISHRYKALAELKTFLDNEVVSLPPDIKISREEKKSEA